MYNQINADTLTKAGQFALSDIQLISYISSDGGSNPKKISIRSQVIEINMLTIYQLQLLNLWIFIMDL